MHRFFSAGMIVNSEGECCRVRRVFHCLVERFDLVGVQIEGRFSLRMSLVLLVDVTLQLRVSTVGCC